MEAMGEMMEHLAARNAEAIEGVAQHVHMELQRVAGEVRGCSSVPSGRLQAIYRRYFSGTLGRSSGV